MSNNILREDDVLLIEPVTGTIERDSYLAHIGLVGRISEEASEGVLCPQRENDFNIPFVRETFQNVLVSLRGEVVSFIKNEVLQYRIIREGEYKFSVGKHDIWRELERVMSVNNVSVDRSNNFLRYLRNRYLPGRQAPILSLVL